MWANYQLQIAEGFQFNNSAGRKGEISRVIKFNGNTRREEFSEVDNWAHESRIIRGKIKRFLVFFKVQTELSIAELIKKQYDFCKECKIWVATKVVTLEHAKRVEVFNGTNNKISSTKWHKQQIEDLIRIKDGAIEVCRQ